jgi:hypothetical protein
MPVLVTAAQLRAVLGVSSSLYNDAALEAIIDTSEDAIGDFLIQWKVGIDKHYSETANETTIHTTRPHKFYETQTVAISGVEAHVNGNKTISAIVDDYTFRITTTGAPIHTDYRFVIPNGLAAENDLSQYNGNAAIEEAILQVAIDVFQSRLAVSGTQQALDFTPAPYRMGRTLLYKITGLISKYIDSNSQVG